LSDFSLKTRGTFSSFAAMLLISTDSRFYSSLISADSPLDSLLIRRSYKFGFLTR
jgi:hypothetical protein